VSGFRVLLGGDYAGKSEAMRRLPAGAWRTVSYDDPYILDFSVVRGSRRKMFFEAFSDIGPRYSTELAFSLLPPVVWHLRDQALREARSGPTVVDSYYYKLLAKGLVSGIADPGTVAVWRSFPRPDGVVFLDVDPEVAWGRVGRVADLNPIEYHGPQPGRDAFLRYQRDLRAAMLAELRGLDVLTVDANRPPGQVAADVHAALGGADPVAGAGLVSGAGRATGAGRGG